MIFKKYFEKRNTFICPMCGHKIVYHSIWDWLACPHWLDEYRWIKCPECKTRYWMKRVEK